MSLNVTVQILRRDAPKGSSYWQNFEVPIDEFTTVLDVLRIIRCQPVTSDGKAVAPVAYESSCGSGLCGTCAVIVNGKPGQGCEMLVADFAQPIRIEPLSGFPVLRDLVTDRNAMLESVVKFQTWSDVDGTADVLPLTRFVESEKMLQTSSCTSCGICQDACPRVSARTGYDGPFAMIQAEMTLQLSSGHSASQRHAVVKGDSGIAGCENVQNCVKACPKKIPLSEMLGLLNRRVSRSLFKNWFG